VKLTTNLDLMLRLRMCGAIPILTHMSSWHGAVLSASYAFMTCLVNPRDNLTLFTNTRGELMVLYILIIKILEKRWKDKRVSKLNGSKHSLKLICSKLLCECNFDLLPSFPNT
jgi:hypothetical protein